MQKNNPIDENVQILIEIENPEQYLAEKHKEVLINCKSSMDSGYEAGMWGVIVFLNTTFSTILPLFLNKFADFQNLTPEQQDALALLIAITGPIINSYALPKLKNAINNFFFFDREEEQALNQIETMREALQIAESQARIG